MGVCSFLGPRVRSEGRVVKESEDIGDKVVHCHEGADVNAINTYSSELLVNDGLTPSS